MLRKGSTNLWLGLCLTSLFFYPLALYLEASPLSMQWGQMDKWELSCAIVLLTILFGAMLTFAESIHRASVAIAFYTLICLVPVLSFLSGLSRQLKLHSFLDNSVHAIQTNDRLIVPLLGLIGGCLAVLVIRNRYNVRHALRKSLFVLSPISVICLGGIARHAFYTPVTEIHQLAKSPVPLTAGPDIFIFLFDEMSYSFLYQKASVRSEFPNIKAFSNISENYHLALSAGSETFTSIPGFLTGQRYEGLVDRNGRLRDRLKDGRYRDVDFQGNNVFKTAKQRGYRTILLGWFNAYCALFGENLDECRSFSIYNYGAIETKFSILHPIYTNLILWPHQMPYGLVKLPLYCWFHKRTVELTYDLAVRSFRDANPTFAFVHFGIPHLPFSFDANGYNPAQDPFLQNSENYVRQLQYVDLLFGRLINELKRNGKFNKANIIIVSDHSYRKMAEPGLEQLHIPLIVKKPRGTVRRDIQTQIKAEVLLKSIVEAGDQ